MPHAELSHRARWLAFVTLCLGELMIVLDSTVVNVALPSIRSSLHDGRALGLAGLASLAAAVTGDAAAAGAEARAALTAGYQAAFLAGALCAAIAAAVGAVFLRPRPGAAMAAAH